MRSRSVNQAGFSLAITLVMLLAMMLMGIVLVRTVDTTNQVANNITFKQAGLAAADTGVETAIAWLGNTANEAYLDNLDQSGLGYYGTTAGFVDFTGTVTPGDPNDDVDWWNQSAAGFGAQLLGAEVNHNKVAYVIHRLCTTAGTPSPTNCVVSSSSAGASGSSKGAGGFAAITPTANEVAYRITTRSTGPKGTVSYVQTVVMKPY